MADRIFLREVRLENIKVTLLFYQNSVGNVSCVVWDAALVLTKYIEKRYGATDSKMKGLKVVELGAGLGCVGITAACFGAEVLLTDLVDVVPQLLKTTELNRMAWTDRGTVECLPLTWGQSVEEIMKKLKKEPDIILLSDCVYYEESVDPLIDTLTKLCGKSTEIILCQEKRESNKHQEIWNKFLNKFIELFTVIKVPVTEQDDTYVSPDICIYSACKKYLN